MKNTNHLKAHQVVEVLRMSDLVTTVLFVLLLLWGKCTALSFNMSERS